MSKSQRRALRVLVLMHEDLVPPESTDGYSEKEVLEWKTEFDVVSGLRGLGHEVLPLGVRTDLGRIGDVSTEFRPHITFNLLEEFHGVAVYDQHVVAHLELLRRPYTGCNPRGLMLARDKALSKKVLGYHRLPVPKFVVFPLGQKVKKPKRLSFPLLVKSLTAEGSEGIAQASVVTSEEKLIERAEFVHRTVGTDAIAEQFIPGRELYVGVLGNQRLRTLPVWEMQLTERRDDAPLIATRKVKWDPSYQKKVGYELGPAKDLPEGMDARISKLSKRIYRRLGLSGYARLDFRLTVEGDLYLLEANPNPDIESHGEFAQAAAHARLRYPVLLQRLLTLGMSYRAQWKVVEEG